MSGTPCENDWYEKVEKETGQEPKEPIQLDGVTEEKDKGQKGAGTEELENNEENNDENEEEIIEIGKESKKVWLCGICRTMAYKSSVKCMGCLKWIHRRYVKNKPNCSGLGKTKEGGENKYTEETKKICQWNFID